jgi:hypothetical protein
VVTDAAPDLDPVNTGSVPSLAVLSMAAAAGWCGEVR